MLPWEIYTVLLLCYFGLNHETSCRVGLLLGMFKGKHDDIILYTDHWRFHGKYAQYCCCVIRTWTLGQCPACHVGVLLLNNTFTVIIEVSVWQLGKVQSSTNLWFHDPEPSGSRVYRPFHVLLWGFYVPPVLIHMILCCTQVATVPAMGYRWLTSES